MKEQFTEDLRLSRANVEKLEIVNDIIEEYIDQGYRLTLRQLYYQLVSRELIPNNKKEYSKLSGLLVKGRMAGEVDWSAIEDRIRVPYLPYWCESVADAIEDTQRYYRLNRQKDQAVNVELWVEKDALSGVLKRITSYYHINLMVNRGYSSCSAMYDAYKRLENYDQNIILYLGDHDPSGLDMIRDITERLAGFGMYGDLEVKQIALTTEQVRHYNPPPNPAKITDPRAKDYIAKFGAVSWEVDALNPKTLNKLVKNEIENIIDMDLFKDQIRQEEEGKKEMAEIIEGLE